MWLLRFRFSLHLAAEKPDPWFACGRGARKGGPWRADLPQGGSPCPAGGLAALQGAWEARRENQDSPASPAPVH